MVRQIPLKANEKIIFSLRSLYDSFGYSQYRMSKFEEYDLYSKNKDFLVSDGVITFTDTNGKLMALKPDVTLSIVKNTKDYQNSVQKLYYNENVYRVSKSLHAFKEIMQVGLECIGNVDNYCVYEVIELAIKSLIEISESSVLDISHLALLIQAVEYVGIPDSEKSEVFRLIGEKNLHELVNKCQELDIPKEKTDFLKELVSLHGTPEKVMPKLNAILDGIADSATLNQFNDIINTLSEFNKHINIDFSVVDNINYYNGIVFKGFVEGVPNSVLSGGQYDKLMKRMKRKNNAIGFAVYLDMLEQMNHTPEKYDVDTVLVYDSKASFADIKKAAEKMKKEGSVLTVNAVPEDVRYKKLVKLECGEVKEIENNA